MIIFEGTAHFSNVSSPKYQRRRLRLPKESRSMASATCPLLFLGDLDLSSGLCHGHFDILGPACDRARTSNAIAYKKPRVCLFPTKFKAELLAYFFKAPA